MRPLTALISILFVLVSLSCKEDQLLINPPKTGLSAGTIILTFADPPPEVAQVVAHVTRNGFADVVVDLTISDTSHTATGEVDGLAAGVWHLRVDALDSAGIIRYTGQTDVNIIGGQIATADLRLLPASGGLEIHVSWGPPDLNTGLMAYYAFEHTLADSSGHGNTGHSLHPLYVADAWADGRSAYQFNDSTNAITVPDSPSLNPDHQLTIAFWLRVDSIVNNYMDVLIKGGQVYGYFANREYGLWVKRLNPPDYYYLELKSAGDSSGMHELNSGGHMIGEWVHIAAVVDRINHSMWFYENGVAFDSVYDSDSTFNVNSDPLFIGWSVEHLYEHSPLAGAIDNLRFYNRALTPEEIYTLYAMHQ